MLKSRHQAEDRLSPPSSHHQKKMCKDSLNCCSSSSLICPPILNSRPVEVREKKSVTFSEEKLAEIFEFEDDPESKSSRKLFWEIMAADRVRFKDRINRLESILSPVLSESHRNIVYVHRVLKPTPSCPLPCSVQVKEFEMVVVSPES